jgi:hypothetical protein
MSVEGLSSTASENVAKATDITLSDNRSVDVKFQKETLLTGANSSGRDITEAIKQNGSTEGSRLTLRELVLSPPKTAPFREYFKAIQKWEGKVVSLSGDTFRATLSPIVGEELEQEAEIYVQDVTPDERSFIEPGAIFYWSIGYLERPSGRVRESVIRFRRLPMWTDNEVKEAGRDLTIYFNE